MSGVYIQRRPEKTPLYGLLRDHFDEFKHGYDATYYQKYGSFRPEIDHAVEKYCRCGIPRFGFARIKCPDPECGESYILPFSCKGHGVCPSCMQKAMLETQLWIVDHLLKEVPHRHVVFTIPKLLRKPFFWHREALNDLSRLAWQCLSTFMRETLGVEDAVPAAVQAIETSGEYLEPNPHIHVIAADGLFRVDGTFRPMPKYDEGARIYLLSLWQKAVCEFALAHEFATRELLEKVRGWQYSGFSVFAERRVNFKRSDEESVKEMRHLAGYIAKPPFALENITWKSGADTVIYRGSGLHRWHKQNFETFERTDFIAAVTAHVPNHRQKYVNAYGEYSNKTRGWKAKKGIGGVVAVGTGATESQRQYRQSWAKLIQMVWEVNPLECPKCGKTMKIVAIVQDKGLVEATLKALGLWQDMTPRGPPIDLNPEPPPELTREPWWDDMPGED